MDTRVPCTPLVIMLMLTAIYPFGRQIPWSGAFGNLEWQNFPILFPKLKDVLPVRLGFRVLSEGSTASYVLTRVGENASLDPS